MWWQHDVVYQIYPRSFADGDGDGIGDLTGLREHLHHLRWLGVDALWLSPIYRSPMADFGYDVSDHCDIDPVFGTLADADAVIAAAHELDLRVVLDFVPNHTSIEHQWWRDHPERFVRRPGRGPDGADPPNNWVRAFPYPPAQPAWTREHDSGLWYLHLFLPEQPDLDWRDPGTVAGQHAVLRFWLDRGIDGFRMDVVHCIGKDPDLTDVADAVAGIPHCVLNDEPDVAGPLLQGIRRVLDDYPGNRVAIGEVVLIGDEIPDRIAAYTGPDRLHLAFDFTALHRRWGDPTRWQAGLARVDAAFDDERGRWPCVALGNHDQPRLRTRWGGDETIARAAAVLQLGLRGTPVLYAGDELGLEDAVIAPEQRVDPGDRDGCRAPLPWTTDAGHGWPVEPWLPFPPDADERSVEAQRADDGSILWLYKRLLAARKASPALHAGAQTAVEGAPEGVVAWDRHHGSDRRRVLVSMTADESPIEPGWVIDVASDDASLAGARASALAPGQALWLRPA